MKKTNEILNVILYCRVSSDIELFPSICKVQTTSVDADMVLL